MKKISILLFVIILSFPLISNAADFEKIDSFETKIVINKDSSINVVELIKYDFGQNQKHGIYRDIPLEYKARGGNYKLKISKINVLNEKNTPYLFTVSHSNNNIHIKIGDANKYVTGIKTYVIQYNINKAINYFDDHDELYWNATGNDWSVPIQSSVTQVTVPGDISSISCFTGSHGETKACESSLISNNTANFTSKYLDKHEGLTIVLSWPKDVVFEPSPLIVFWRTVEDNMILFLPFLTLIICFYLWNKYGKDPAGRKTIVTQFEEPDHLTPVQVGALIDGRVNNLDLTADILSLATKGYLQIQRIKRKGILVKTIDYKLEKILEPSNSLGLSEKELLKSLFKKGKKIVFLSSLKNTFYKDLEKIKKQVYKSLVEGGYFVKSPKTIRRVYSSIGVIVGWVGGQFIGQHWWGILGLISFIVSGAIIIAFSYIMPVRTKKGVLAREHILGLKRYLSIAEKDRLDFHNAPEKEPALFDRLLPFAIALRVEKKWANQFKDIYTQQPKWYNDTTGRMFVFSSFISDINNFSVSTSSLLSSRSSSASSGGSGFGGGFSGGGFGGGGGGSW